MNLFQIAYLSDDQVQMFQSDFKIVADYFVQMRKNHDYIAPDLHYQTKSSIVPNWNETQFMTDGSCSQRQRKMNFARELGEMTEEPKSYVTLSRN